MSSAAERKRQREIEKEKARKWHLEQQQRANQEESDQEDSPQQAPARAASRVTPKRSATKTRTAQKSGRSSTKRKKKVSDEIEGGAEEGEEEVQQPRKRHRLEKATASTTHTADHTADEKPTTGGVSLKVQQVETAPLQVEQMVVTRTQVPLSKSDHKPRPSAVPATMSARHQSRVDEIRTPPRMIDHRLPETNGKQTSSSAKKTASASRTIKLREKHPFGSPVPTAMVYSTTSAIAKPPPTFPTSFEIQEEEVLVATQRQVKQDPPDEFSGSSETSEFNSEDALEEEIRKEEGGDLEEVVESQARNAVALEKKSTWLYPTLGLIAVVLLSFGLSIMLNDGELTLSNIMSAFTASVQQSGPTCFQANDERHNDLPPHCENAVLVPCPEHGICNSGALDACSTYFSVADSGDKCVLSTDSSDSISAVVDVLVNWTKAEFCGTLGNSKPVEHHKSGRPLFLYTQLCDELEIGYDLNLLEAANENTPVFLIQFTERGVLIGLDPKVQVYHASPCYIKNLLRMCLGWTWALIVLVCAFLSNVSISNPWIPFLCFIGMFLYRSIQSKREESKRMERELMNIRLRVHQELAAKASVPHRVLALRDRIMFDVYPTSMAARARLESKVWPRVVKDIRCDNRIKKSMDITETQSFETWQWVDVVSPSSSGQRVVTFEQ